MRGLLAIGGRREVGVVGAAAVLRFGQHRVRARATLAEVVDLEVARGFVETVRVQDVVDDVVQVEEVLDRDRRVPGSGRLRGEVRGGEEVTVGHRSAAAVRPVVAVHVEVRVGVVAGDVGRLLRAAAQPACGRQRIAHGRPGHHRLRPLARVFEEHVVAIRSRPAFHVQHGAIAPDQGVVELVALLRPGFNEPAARERAVAHRNGHRRDGGRAVEERAAVERRRVALRTGRREHDGFRGVHAGHRGTKRLRGIHLGRRRAGHVDQPVDDLHQFASRVDGSLEVGAVDGEPFHHLFHAHVRHAIGAAAAARRAKRGQHGGGAAALAQEPRDDVGRSGLAGGRERAAGFGAHDPCAATVQPGLALRHRHGAKGDDRSRDRRDREQFPGTWIHGDSQLGRRILLCWPSGQRYDM